MRLRTSMLSGIAALLLQCGPDAYAQVPNALTGKITSAEEGAMEGVLVSARKDGPQGRFVEYLLPRSTNIRRSFVDNSTTPVTFWEGSNHGASIVKLEPLD